MNNRIEGTFSHWRPIIVDAVAVDPYNFAIAYADLGGQISTSIVLTYDGTLDQPWGRTDIPGELSGLVVDPVRTSSGRAEYMGVTVQGVAYHVEDDGSFPPHVIPGAGYEGPEDEPLRGRINGMSTVAGTAVAFGDNGQLYAYESAEWNDISLPREAPTGWQLPSFRALAGHNRNDMLAVGSRARAADYSVLSDPNALARMSEEEILEAVSGVSSSAVPMNYSVRLRDGAWNELTSGTGELLSCAIATSDGGFVFGGANGQLMRLDNSAPLEPTSVLSENENAWVTSVNVVEDALVISTDRRLFTVIGGALSPILPPVRASSSGAAIAPFGLRFMEDHLFYFDHMHGVLIRNRNGWERIEMPAALLAQPAR